MKEFNSYKKIVLVSKIYILNILVIYVLTIVGYEGVFLSFLELLAILMMVIIYFAFVFKVLETENAILYSLSRTEKWILLSALGIKILEFMWAMLCIEYLTEKIGMALCIIGELFIIFIDCYAEYRIGKMLHTCIEEVRRGLRYNKRHEIIITGHDEELERYNKLYLEAIVFLVLSFIQIVLYSIEKETELFLLIICIKGFIILALISDYVKKVRENKVLMKYVKKYSYVISLIMYIVETTIYFIKISNHWMRLGVMCISIVFFVIFYVNICDPIEKIVRGIKRGSYEENKLF